MNLRLNIAALVLGCGVIAVPAHAATTTGEGETSDDCGGSCDLPSPTVSIISPTSGDELASPVSVTVEASDLCACDTCGCYEVSPDALTLSVDGEVVTTCEACASPHTFEIELPPGVHELRAQSLTPNISPQSEVVTITVTSDDTTSPTTGGTPDPTSGGSPDPTSGGPQTETTGSSGAPASDSSDGGCSFGGSNDGPLAIASIGMLLAFLRRRP